MYEICLLVVYRDVDEAPGMENGYFCLKFFGGYGDHGDCHTRTYH